jgi:CRP/FNR family transcriptional regulator
MGMERKEALRRVVFLKALPDDAIEMISAGGQERVLDRGEVLVHEHQRCMGLIVVLTGGIKIYKLDSRGRELTLGLEGPGSSVAEMPLFDGGNYPAAAEAVEEGTRVFILPRERFQEVMARYPEIAGLALRALAIRMRKLVQLVEAQSLHTVRARLASYLVEASEGRSQFTLAETNEEIGSHIGTVRDVVSRTLGGLRDANVIALNGRQVVIRDSVALRRIAEAFDR